MRFMNKRCFWAAVIFFTVLSCTACQGRVKAEKEAGTGQYQSETTFQNEAADTNEGLQVHFIDVGQADASLITCDGHAMLFDTGENDTGVLLQFYLMEQGIERLDYVIGSHPESDHIGGMDVVLLKYDCDKVMLPDVETDTTTYKDVLEAAEKKKDEITYPEVGETYSLGSASFTIIAPNDDYGDNMNNYSIGIKLVYGDNSFIFTGDAEREAEEDILNNGISLDADVLKAGHHGSHDASCETFVEAVSPDYAVISCGKENDYGHPHRETLDIFEEAGAVIFRTDEQGTIIASSDGKEITWNLADWSLEEAKSEHGIYYVGNKNNGKLHISTCTALPKDWNQVIFETREEAVEAGFSEFCSGCKP